MWREHNRKLNRLKDFDYSDNGYYFVTFCTRQRMHYFGEIMNQKMILNNCGKIVKFYWQQIPKFYNDVEIDIFQIMPNHIHGIIIINSDGVGTGHCPVPTNGHCPVPTREHQNYGLLSKIINGFKNVCTKTIHKQYSNIQFLWQRSYYDHIIRNEKDYERIYYYILNNPKNWKEDRNNILINPTIIKNTL